MTMNLNGVLEKYFTKAENEKLNSKLIFSEKENELNVDDIKFSIKNGKFI